MHPFRCFPAHSLSSLMIVSALLVVHLLSGSVIVASFAAPAATQGEDAAKGAAAAADAKDGAPSPMGIPVSQDAAWEAAWSSQTARLDEISRKADAMSEAFAEQSANLGVRVRPFTEEARRLLVFSNTYKDWPNTLEAVSRRIMLNVQNLRRELAVIIQARAKARSLLENVGYMADNLPEDFTDEGMSQEMKDYAQKLTRTRLRLMAAQAQYDFALAPSLALMDRLEKNRADIDKRLPLQWKDYYLQAPLPWLSADAWEQFGQRMRSSLEGMMLRVSVEIPLSSDRWGSAILRFFIALLVAGALSTLLYRRLAHRRGTPATRHMFHVSLPWLCLGLALLACSLTNTGEVYRLFLALGNLCLIVAQIHLAWDLRMLKYPEVPRQKPPFWALIEPTLCSYVLLYLPLTSALVLIVWLGIVIVALVRQRRRAEPDLGPLLVESSVLECEPVVLWLCLLLALVGLHIYSMVLYLVYVSCSLALQMCLGGMGLVSTLNEKLPREGARAVLAHLAVALAAPVALVITVVGVLQWVATLPGGTYLLSYYLPRGVNLGDVQFNIVHLLLIITMFYLTRTAVAMGTRFLERLPRHGLAIDATLIQPLQTAFTYALWCFFGLFTLRALGMELSNLAMVAGGLSVGIGFGMQTIVNNFLSGLILIFSRTLQTGDVVEIGGTTGRVRKISVRATMVETFDNALIIVPNSEFISNRLINWTRNSRTVRKTITVGVAYGSDTDQVIKLLLAAANAHDNVLKYPPPSVVFTNFGDNTLDFSLRFWVRDYDVAAGTTSEIRLAVEKIFREHGVEVAFPQLDVHIRDVPGGAAIPPRTKRTLLSPGRKLRVLRSRRPSRNTLPRRSSA